MAEEQKFTTELSIWTNSLNGLVAKDFEENGVEYDEYSRKCGMNAMTSIYNLVKASGESIKNIDTSNLRDTVAQTASLKLNPNGYPKECFYKLVTKKIGDNNYIKQVEMSPEGAGFESLLRNFGIGVKKVYPTWVVHDGDEFVYPKRKGLTITPPEWEERGLSQKVLRVVVPIELDDGNVDYRVSERESVKSNLFAHVRNNLMNETFGVLKGNNAKGKPKTRYDATPEELAEINARKEVIFKALRECETVDDMLKCEVARPYMSDAWLETTEGMLTRKMINNACRSFPKDFSAMAQKSLIALDETYRETQDDIKENANTEIFVDAEVGESNGNEVFADVAP